MTKICDLHTHSIYSDGTYTPSEIIDAAIGIGLSAVALCDHNTIDGLYDFLSAAEGKSIEAVAGAEFSVDYEGTELHLLGLYIPKDRFEDITNIMTSVSARKEQSNINLVNSLNKDGYLIDYDTIKSKSPNGKINRAHIAAELTNLGYTGSIKQAFDTLLSPEAGHYTEPERLNVFDMIKYIKGIGAVPVLAHPFLNLTEDRLKSFLSKATQAGLKGMECYYSLYDQETTEKALKISNDFGVLPSGGSDFHGTNKPDIMLGVGRGNLCTPFEWALELKKSAGNCSF